MYPINQQVSPCYHPSLTVPKSYHSKVTPVGALLTEKIAESILLYVFRIAFPASRFWRHFESLCFLARFMGRESWNALIRKSMITAVHPVEDRSIIMINLNWSSYPDIPWCLDILIFWNPSFWYPYILLFSYPDIQIFNFPHILIS